MVGGWPSEAARILQQRTWGLLRNSLALAGTVSVLATALGLGSACWIASGPKRMKRIARATFVAPLLIPPYVYALAWLALLRRDGLLNRSLIAVFGVSVSPYGFFPAAVVLSLVFSPIVILLALSTLDSIESSLIEAAQILDDPHGVWRRVVLPLALPAILAGMGLTFALTLVEYGVPALLEFNVYSMEIHAEFSQTGDPVAAMRLALPLLIPAAVLVALSQLGQGRTPLRARPGGCPALRALQLPFGLSAWGRASVLVLAIAVLVPVIVLSAQARTVAAVWQASRAASQEIRLSLTLALGVALAATLLSVTSSRVLSRSRRGWLWALHALPLTIPAPLYAIGLIHLCNRPLPVAIYGTPFMLLLAHTGRFLPHSTLALVTQFRRVDPTLHEAARMHEVGWHRRTFRVHLPLLARGLIASAGIVFALSLGELGASLLVVPPGSATLSLRLFNLLHYGASQSVAGLALAGLALTALAGAATLWLLRRSQS